MLEIVKDAFIMYPHGIYVWGAYIFFWIVLIINILVPIIKYKKYLIVSYKSKIK